MSEFSGILANYEVNVGNGRTVTMHGDAEALDKIVLQIQTHGPMLEVLEELIQAFYDYQMDVDLEPPQKHISMMQRAKSAIRAAKGTEL